MLNVYMSLNVFSGRVTRLWYENVDIYENNVISVSVCSRPMTSSVITNVKRSFILLAFEHFVKYNSFERYDIV